MMTARFVRWIPGAILLLNSGVAFSQVIEMGGEHGLCSISLVMKSEVKSLHQKPRTESQKEKEIVELRRKLLEIKAQGLAGSQTETQQFLEQRYQSLFQRSTQLLIDFAEPKQLSEIRKDSQVFATIGTTVLAKSEAIDKLLAPARWGALLKSEEKRQAEISKIAAEIQACRTQGRDCLLKTAEKVSALREQVSDVALLRDELKEEAQILTDAAKNLGEDKSNTALTGILAGVNFFVQRFSSVASILEGAITSVDGQLSSYQTSANSLSQLEHGLMLLVLRGAPKSVIEMEARPSASAQTASSEGVREKLRLMVNQSVVNNTFAATLDSFFMSDRRPLSPEEVIFVLSQFPPKLNWGGNAVNNEVYAAMKFNGVGNWGHSEWESMHLGLLYKTLTRAKRLGSLDVSQKEALQKSVSKIVEDYFADTKDNVSYKDEYKISVRTYFNGLFAGAVTGN